MFLQNIGETEETEFFPQNEKGKLFDTFIAPYKIPTFLSKNMTSLYVSDGTMTYESHFHFTSHLES